VVGVEVDRSETTTKVERLKDGGVRSTVESVAEGITVALPLGTVTIGEVRSRAVSFANGRPQRRDRMSDHDIGISHVRVGDGDPLCATACDPAELEETLNLLAGSRAVFRTGHGANSGRDEALVRGSDRGAQTAVQKSRARQASDRALVGDFTVEVPALEVTVFNDNPQWGRARQIYQFAGVASAATYNVVPRPTGLGLPDDDGGLAEEPSVGDGGSTVFEGLIDGLDDGGLASAPAAFARPENDGDGGGLAGAVRALARGLRLFLTSPRTALLLLTAWALLGSPAVLSRRRRLLAGVRSG
jgi:hypothetical protein